MIRKFLMVVAMGLLSTACASVIDGTSQEITFYSNPPEAECALERAGKPLSRVVTPGTVTVKKTKHGIKVVCAKEGYHDAHAFLDSKIQDATWGNIILGGGIGWAIDSASGADNKYDKSLTVTLVPLQEAANSGVAVPVASVEQSALAEESSDEPADEQEAVEDGVSEEPVAEDEALAE